MKIICVCNIKNNFENKTSAIIIGYTVDYLRKEHMLWILLSELI